MAVRSRRNRRRSGSAATGRSASSGATRLARRTGASEARTVTTTPPTKPSATASGGTARPAAIPPVSAAARAATPIPTTTPTAEPSRPVSRASASSIRRTCGVEAPTARSRPISRRRWVRTMTRVLSDGHRADQQGDRAEDEHQVAEDVSDAGRLLQRGRPGLGRGLHVPGLADDGSQGRDHRAGIGPRGHPDEDGAGELPGGQAGGEGRSHDAVVAEVGQQAAALGEQPGHHEPSGRPVALRVQGEDAALGHAVGRRRARAQHHLVGGGRPAARRQRRPAEPGRSGSVVSSIAPGPSAVLKAT